MLDLRPVLAQFPDLSDAGRPPVAAATLPVERMSGGLINDTFAVGSSWVLQRLHPIFRAEVNLDIAALTPHLQRAGVTVPTIATARDGRPYVLVPPTEPPEVAGVWRLMTRLPGRTLHRLEHAGQARSAGHLVGQFHAALANVTHIFAFSRPGAHDTDRHLALLAQAVADHPHHRLHAQVAPLADELAERWARWGRIPALPQRIVHGDLKVSNLLFEGDTAAALLDLDTMAAAGLDVEMGDALRSWCNPSTEDDPSPRFDLATGLQAAEGWLQAAAPFATEAEVACLPSATLRICLELSARFAADALNEAYFGWDPHKAPARGEHNLMRARNQLGLARDVDAHRGQFADRLETIYLKVR